MKAVILAGGGGTRLWPLSTTQLPKQFQKLVSKKTMLEETINRLDFLEPKDIYLAINEDHYQIVRKLCPQIPVQNIIIEPALRDTAPCIGLAASVIAKRYPDEVMAVVYADHLIQKKKAFQEKLKIAAEIAAKENTLNIIEVKATEPNTSYGYVKIGKLKQKINETEIYEFDSFKEKPDLATAKKFLKSGKFLWNTGIYVWKASVILEHYKKLAPKLHANLQKIMDAYDNQTGDATINALYPQLEKISIDYAIMEKVPAKEVRIIKADLGWSDIGTWEAIWEELPKNTENNVVRGEVQLLDCKNSLIYGDTNKKVCVIGVDDLIIVDTEDGLLIAKKKEAKRIKEIPQN